MDELPDWDEGTPAVLVAHGPHAIPISTAIRRGPDRITFALARRRETLKRIREDQAIALVILAPNLAITAYGTARVIKEELDAAPTVAGLELQVDRLQDHLEGARTEILEAAQWRWTEDEAAETDAQIRAELRAL
jgi:hypothetical protein